MRGREENKVTGVSTNNKDQYKIKFEKLYQNEFEDGLLTIFQDTESIYINKILTRIKLAIGEITPKIDEKIHGDIFKLLDEKLTDKYYQTKKHLLKHLNEFKKSSNLKASEFFFRKHCKKCPDVALHTCKNRLILIKENNEPKYVICSECKVVFLANSLILYCNTCNGEYYSSVVSNFVETEYQPATWENYHCGSFLNEQMSCIKCKDLLFIRNSDSYLCCLKCNFSSDPRKLVWICTICKNEFQSNAKIHNSIEFKIIKNSIKEALLSKTPAKPMILPCCGSDLALITTFKHKKQCQGDLYLGELGGKAIVVCAKCKSVNSAEGFVWTCPKCDGKFKNDRKNSHNPINTINIAFNSPNLHTPSKNKNIINDDKIEASQFVRKNIMTKSTIIKESLNERIERINNLKIKEVEVKNQELYKRSNSVYKYTNKNSNMECNINNMKNVSSFYPIKEEDIEKDNKIDEKLTSEDEEETFDVKSIIIEKKTIIGLLENNDKEQNNLRANNSKNSNSSNNNNETTDTLSRTSIKNNAPIPIPNKIKNKLIHRHTINNVEEESCFDIEKEILGDSDKHKILKNSRNMFSTPECQGLKKSESGIKNISIFNSEIREDYNNLKKISTPIPNYSSSCMNLNVKNCSNSDKNIVNINVNKTTKKTLFFGEKVEKEDSIKEDISIIRPLEVIKIEDYKIRQNIGEGSFGIIYLSENIKTKEKFAMKKIIVNNEQELNLFMSEFELVNKFPHSNILTIYGLCNKTLDFSTKVLYILMELAISDWDKEIKNRFKLNSSYKEQELIYLLKQIVLSLSFLQERGISHRDIKPQNILIFPSNTYKVADFGEAKEVKQANKQMETLRGTELYMSPILFTTLRNSEKNNVKHNAFKSDVFSLGYCILYAATLSYKILYDLRNVNNQKYVNNIIKTYISKRYSAKFVEFVTKMVDVNESNRFDFIELNKYLNVNF